MVFTLIKSADFNQAAECLPSDARGRQCVPTCLMFLLTSRHMKPCITIQTEDLNEILFAGSHLYCALHQLVSTSDLIDPVSLPERISYNDKTVYIKHVQVLSGFMEENANIDGQNYFKLEDAFSKACVRGVNLIIVFNGLSIAVLFDSFQYYIFDSHSRDENGMPCPDGKCVLGCVDSVFDLCTYLRSLSYSFGLCLARTQFDLRFLQTTTRYRYTGIEVQIFNKRQGFKIRDIKRRVCGADSADSAKRQKFKDLMKGKSYKNVVDDRYMHDSCAKLRSPEPVHNQSSDRTDLPNDKSIPEQNDSIFIRICKSDDKQVYVETQNTNLVCSEGTSVEDEVNLMLNVFERLVSVGPDYVCSCCTQTFFRHFMKNVKDIPETYKSYTCRFLTKYISVGNIEWICRSCLNATRQGKIPPFWVNNGLQFPVQPKELQLSNIEERLVSPRLPFMQLREMPRGGQVNLKGNIVNVPADVNSIIKSLPRMIDENETIMLKLKRKLSYKHHMAFENIRPNKVFEAAIWLVENSDLFKNEGIVVNENWLHHPHEMSACSDLPEQEYDGNEAPK